jgi:hypothetical protein
MYKFLNNIFGTLFSKGVLYLLIDKINFFRSRYFIARIQSVSFGTSMKTITSTNFFAWKFSVK